MIETITFGADAGHLMEQLLEHVGIDEVGEMAVRVRSEGVGAVLELLRRMAEGGWIVGVTGQSGDSLDLALSKVESGGVLGYPIDERGRPTGKVLGVSWAEIDILHID